MSICQKGKSANLAFGKYESVSELVWMNKSVFVEALFKKEYLN